MKVKIPFITTAAVPVVENEEDNKSRVTYNSIEDRKNGSQNDDDVDSSDLQYGVKAVQASNQVWTKNQLVLAYILIWVIHFVLALSSGINATLTPYVTSAFQSHSLTATTTIISSMISGLIVLPYAKLINVWGRPQGFALMVFSMTIGLIMMAGCNNVKTYCAAQ
ncbi:hypothetical protein CU097_001422, partial [Rhizopus azygosporus]